MFYKIRLLEDHCRAGLRRTLSMDLGKVLDTSSGCFIYYKELSQFLFK